MRHNLKVSEAAEIHAGPAKFRHVLTNPVLIKEHLEK
jgi:hypothetical protein